MGPGDGAGAGCREVLVGKEYTVLAICASGGCLDFCSPAYLPIISLFSHALRNTSRYRLKYLLSFRAV